jgi:hypothetical protein
LLLLDNPIDFQPDHLILRDRVVFEPLTATPQDTLRLADALQQGQVLPESPLQVFKVGEQMVALSTVHMIYHHVAQGVTDGVAWMMSFCVICNTGNCFSPLVNDERLEFVDRGFYNAMTILGDAKTDSLWHHVSGRCLRGALHGQQLTSLSVPRQLTVTQALLEFPNCMFVLSRLNAEQAAIADEEDIGRKAESYPISSKTATTFLNTDPRLPRLELGIGVWTDDLQRFYPMTSLYARNNVLLDRFGTQNLLVYVDPTSDLPGATFTTATSGKWIGDTLLLNNGDQLKRGVISGKTPITRPFQLFQRWYSFVTLFPHGSVFGHG